ncbi:arsenosugar biosynthesis radical SAM (seleno)protein ArsS [Acanthopleuribacter pedis]|uniref:Arsenosugar biosynthesis radical SAM protein ArsS n=1 Tax=Acanthopleuribacter pedis TaxID=442870 RepID=A0A8J7U2F9_9BACT|nr:arsenosugar biosynthesis radical SAM (seleno)protein ArsS [Acanthopleuribacter pedis]MBO1319278.1 arsenosugar biosynthesis radical SAM protein ArsS [Acanthopleuribacter pedis]
MTTCRLRSFQHTIEEHGLTLDRRPLEILQVNVGKLCNQACQHCHVEAGPKRTEIMTLATMERLLVLLEATPSIHSVDITGGAPELNPHFRTFVKRIRAQGRKVMDRCNLTVLFEPGQEDTAQFLADNQVEVVASLPCYSKENVESQRGRGVFDKSILGLQKLNALGYGRPGSGLELSLVYNPLGAFLPPPQAKLEQDYRRELKNLFGIDFNRLFTITNMPIKRFGDVLKRHNQWDTYMELLVANFNPAAVDGVMCRNLISIGWDGAVYDCDFNQMLEIPASGKATTIHDIPSFAVLARAPIALADHCYGCTAGAGSSCGGALV